MSLATTTEIIGKTEAAAICGVSRQSIHAWINAGKLKVDSKGRILRQPFEAARAPHTIIGRLQATIAELPAHQLPFILIEVLGPDYVQALGNIARGDQSNKTGERKQSGDGVL
jgi:hypothetical protein